MAATISRPAYSLPVALLVAATVGILLAGCVSMPATGRPNVTGNAAEPDTDPDTEPDARRAAAEPDGEWEGSIAPIAPSRAPATDRTAERANESEWSGQEEWWVQGGRSRPRGENPAAGSNEWTGADDWWTRRRIDIPEPDSSVVVVEFTGNNLVTAGILTVAAQDELRLLESTSGDPTVADDAAWAMVVECRHRGFHFARVDFELADEPGPARRTRCRFVVDEGPRVAIGDVRFLGASRFDPSDLRSVFAPDQSLLAPASFFVEALIKDAIRELINRYVRAGHLQVTIGQPEFDFVHVGTEPPAPPDTVNLTVVITEGPLYRVDHLELVGPDDGWREAIHARLADIAGSPYRRGDHSQIIARIREFYRDRGFYAVEVGVTAAIDDRLGSVDLTIAINPGVPWHVGNVRIVTDSLSPGFVRSIIPLRGGETELYSLSRERETYRQLLRTNLVQSVEFERHPDPGRRRIDYVVRVHEIRSIVVRPHLGWGSFEGPRARLTLAETNLFGTAREVGITGGISLRSHWAEARLIDPWTLGGEFPVSISAFYRKREEPDFTRQDIGGRLSLAHQFTPTVDANVFYEFRDTRAFDITDPAFTSAETAQLGSVGIRLRYTDAEPLLVPRQGMRHSFLVEHYNQLLGANLDFTKFRLDSALYLPLDPDKRVVLAFGYTLEFFLVAGDTATSDVPIQERVYNGGATSVRAFREQDLRLWEDPAATAGGQLRQVLGTELRFPLLWDFGLDGAVFFDFGNLSPDLAGVFDHFRVALGIGLRYMTPIGPARLDVAWNTYPRNEEDRFNVHFWIGFPF